jgi:hypothetical protein
MIVLATGRAGERALVGNVNTNLADLDDDRITLRVTAVTADTTFVVPANYRISSIDVINTTANAVTGGVNFGTAAAGAQILSATAVGANARISPDPLLRHFAAQQTVHVSAVTAWNSANLTLVVILDQISDAGN